MITRRQRRPSDVCALAFAATLFVATAPVGAQIIDRVLAVVAGTPITLSDVSAALRFGLVPPVRGEETPERAALEALIDRHLQLIEVNRYLPPEPSENDIAARVAAIRARFPTDAAFEAALTETGVDPAQLRARVRDTLRIENYVQQRFGSGFQPSEEEILRYYRTHPGEFTRDGALRPFPEMREAARRSLLEDRANALMRDWLSGLRNRVDVTVLAK